MKLYGDETELYARHHKELLRRVRRRVSTSVENVEDACSFAWMQLMSTDPGRDLPVLAWLTTVAVHEALRLHQVQGRGVELTDALAARTRDHHFDPEVATQARRALQAVAQLPPRQRDALARKIAGYSYDEIGDQTGDSFRTVDRLLVRARKQLRQDP